MTAGRWMAWIMGMEPGAEEPEPPGSIEDFPLYSSPWVSGTRALHYFGPVVGGATFKHLPDFGPTLEDLLVKVAARALAHGANCMVGVEIQVEILTDGFKIDVTGTACDLDFTPGW